jgi:hypothetical protein
VTGRLPHRRKNKEKGNPKTRHASDRIGSGFGRDFGAQSGPEINKNSNRFSVGFRMMDFGGQKGS